MAVLPLSSPGEIGSAGLNRILQLVARVEDDDVADLHPEPGGGWSLALGKARLTWSAAGAAVTKTLVPHLLIPHWAALLGTPRRAALNELRVNRLLSERPPPVPVPMLGSFVGHLGPAPTPPGLSSGPARRNKYRYLPVGLGLVLGVRRIGGYGSVPPNCPFLATDLTHFEVEGLRAVLEHDRCRVSLQVVVPQRVFGSATLGRYKRVLAVVLDAHQREFANVDRPVPAGRYDDYWQAGVAQGVRSLAARALVLFHLVPHPLLGARLVLTFYRHALEHRSAPSLTDDRAVAQRPTGGGRRTPPRATGVVTFTQ